MYNKIKKTLVISVALISLCLWDDYALVNQNQKDYQLKTAGNIEIYDMSENNTAKIEESNYIIPPKFPYPQKPCFPIFW